ncbi:bacteriocin resistance YdeI/OmpD-like protein [Dysgonomonas alginatilytica]|uniref:Bacteriocin resistance YdeI/OmpD-like protein n=1 Tax=Dysgonomonas alginatilytica TaxID=1605892 RepID=A0A2V3PI25_9BACT|nr:YdeI/OmpD-associated family protein [Dysgonomonas alginatilytica]PXV58937.1 bacteriocin resistance YdeI/OmpD-like protein [Dysgonomonas alginatilytica]
METEKALVDKDYLLQKFEGKGGWTYVEIPDIPMPKTSFGMLKVKGKIDDYEFSNVRLMPLGNGHLMLAVKSEIRKKIKKQAGDTVHITLYEDNLPTVIPEELVLCMKYEDNILEKFETYSDGEKKAFVDWIYSAKTEQTKVDRIAKTITMIESGEKFYKIW